MYYTYLLVCLSLISQTCQKEQIIMTLKYSTHRLKPVIVNGEPAPRGKVPFIVSIKKPIGTRLSNTYNNVCGGSIINKRKVLTAAHCFEQHNFLYAKRPSSLRVVAGELRNVVYHSRRTTNNPETQWRKISIVALHPHFNFPLDDIAVVIVKADWYFSNSIGSIRLARHAIDYSDSCYVAGYGRTGHGSQDQRSEVLLMAKIDVLSRNQCSHIWEIIMDDFVCSNAVTADVSVGDSGGPLTCKGTYDPEEVPGTELLTGVTSGKNYDKTTLFTRVSAYADWIDHTNKGSYLKNCCFVSYLFFCVLNTLAVFYVA